jgi:hypothetical protein
LPHRGVAMLTDRSPFDYMYLSERPSADLSLRPHRCRRLGQRPSVGHHHDPHPKLATPTPVPSTMHPAVAHAPAHS